MFLKVKNNTPILKTFIINNRFVKLTHLIRLGPSPHELGPLEELRIAKTVLFHLKF